MNIKMMAKKIKKMSRKIIMNNRDLIEFDYKKNPWSKKKRVRGIVKGFEVDEDYDVSIIICIGAYSRLISIEDEDSGSKVTGIDNNHDKEIVCMPLDYFQNNNWKMIRKGNSVREISNFFIE